MKRFQLLKFFTFNFLATLLFSCQSSGTKEAPSSTPSTASWYDYMQDLAHVFVEISPALVSRNSFERLAAKSSFKDRAQTLENISGKIASYEERPHFDPTLSLVSAEFDSNIRLASQALKKNNFDEAFARFKLTQSYCIACHTLLESQGDAFLGFDLTPASKDLNPFEKGDLWIVLRRFSEALKEYEKGLKENLAKDPVVWRLYFEKLMILSVRVFKDPSLSMEFVSYFIDSKSFPDTETEGRGRLWRAALSQWRNEESKKSKTAPKDPLATVETLLNQGLSEKSNSSNLTLSVYRASSLLHESLAKGGKLAKSAKALYLAGKISEIETPVNLNGVLPLGYYERCILSEPGSSFALKCFSQLEAWLKNSKASGLPTPSAATLLRLKFLGSKARGV